MAINPLSTFTPELKARFLGKVDQRGADECWPWRDRPTRQGYGRFEWVINGFKTSVYATHISLFLDGRPRPDGAHALHSCDYRLCNNPNHLRWGTPMENVADMISRNRQVHASGILSANGRLTDEEIRAIISDTRKTKYIATDFGITVRYVNQLRNGMWRKAVTECRPG